MSAGPSTVRQHQSCRWDHLHVMKTCAGAKASSLRVLSQPAKEQALSILVDMSLMHVNCLQLAEDPDEGDTASSPPHMGVHSRRPL